jgi:glutamate-1-semialdehyde 2,1-aminomutase
LDSPEIQVLYQDLEQTWNDRAAQLNFRLGEENLPVKISNLSTIWTVSYSQPSRYNWMLQYYLRAEGLALSWVGTGRLIFSLNYSDTDFAAVSDRFLAACRAMRRDGWWWAGEALDNRSIKRRVLWEMLTQHRFRTIRRTDPFAQ